MADAKIEIKIGSLTFSGQGEEKWLSDQLDKLLTKAGDLAAISVPPSESPASEPTGHGSKQTTLLLFE
jgi:hypothetical protein